MSSIDHVVKYLGNVLRSVPSGATFIVRVMPLLNRMVNFFVTVVVLTRLMPVHQGAQAICVT